MPYRRPVPSSDATTPVPSTARQRWLARAAILFVVLAAVSVIASAGYTGLFLVVTGLIRAAALLAGMFWFLAKRGMARWIGLGLRRTAIAFLIYSYARPNVILVALISLALLAIGVGAAQAALYDDTEPWMPERDVSPARPRLHRDESEVRRRQGGPVRSAGQGRSPRSRGRAAGRARYVDVAALVRDAVDRGADLLGVAGGDGTQALVAGIAAEHDLPFLVISAGTRNHFALDLGLDRDDPSTCLDAAARRRRGAGRPGHDRRPAVRQQRLVRRLRRDRAEPGVSGQQGGHHPVDAARPADHGPGCALGAGRQTLGGAAPRRCWSATTPTGPGG